MARKWLKKAINPAHRGRVRAYVRRKYGAKAFTQRGTIKPEYLNKAQTTKNASLKRAIILANRLRKM